MMSKGINRKERIKYLIDEQRVAPLRKKLQKIFDELIDVEAQATVLTAGEAATWRKILTNRFGKINDANSEFCIRGLALNDSIRRVTDYCRRQSAKAWYILCGCDSDIGVIQICSTPTEKFISALCDFDREIIFIGSDVSGIAVIDMQWEEWSQNTVECDVWLWPSDRK